MNNRQKVGLAIISSFGAGFYAGSCLMLKHMNGRIKRSNLVANAFKSAIDKAKENDWTYDEFRDELNKELEFIEIVHPK